MREIEIAREKRGKANCKTPSRRKKRDPARKRARQKKCGDCAGECDVNGPGYDQGALKGLRMGRARIAAPVRPITHRLLPNMKSNFGFRLFWRRHQLPNGVNDCRDFFAMFTDSSLHFGKFLRQVAICLKNFTQFYESPHDCYIDSYRAFTPQHARQHCHALFSKCIGQVPSTASSF